MRECRRVSNQHFLAARSIGVANRFLLSGKKEVEVLWRAVPLPENRHHLQDVDVHLVRVDELEAGGSVTPHLLQLHALRSEQRIDEVEGVELNTFAVNLRENIADLVDPELLIEFDIRNPGTAL